MSNWPKNADGSNKKIGKMTAEERRAQFKASAERIKAGYSEAQSRADAIAIMASEPDNGDRFW